MTTIQREAAELWKTATTFEKITLIACAVSVIVLTIYDFFI
jgi:hypothetical protein